MDNLGYALDYSPDSKPLSKNLYNVMLQYADSSQKKKNYRKALRLSKDAIELFPDMPSAHVFTGNIYYNQDNFFRRLRVLGHGIRA